MVRRDDASKLTPVMRQYHAAKAAYPDAILFFRLGDFYEMFHEDAAAASRALDIVLTSRNKGAPDEVPMAGVPVHAAAGHVARLLAQGFKVAICEQMADPAKTRGIVPREVVKVITPGLVTDEGQLDGRSSHFLCVLEEGDGGPVGLALLDLSTAELLATEVGDRTAVLAELARVEPREVLASNADLERLVRAAAPRAAASVDPPLDAEEAAGVLRETMGGEAAEDARTALGPLALVAVGRALRLARRCTPGAALPVRRVAAWDTAATLRIDEVAQAHLEIVRAADGGRRGSLLGVVDETRTPPGARRLRRWLLAPLVDVAAIRRRHDAVEALVAHARTRADLRARLGEVGDLERLAVRAALGEATPRDLGALRDGLGAAPLAVAAARSVPDAVGRDALGADDDIDDAGDLGARLRAALVDRPPAAAKDGGIFREGFDAELDELRALRQSGTGHVLALEARLRETAGVPTIKVRYTRVFGWYIEVTRTHAAKVPASWRRKQTVATGERFTCDELDELAERLAHAEERFEAREDDLWKETLRATGAQVERVRRLAEVLARWDALGSLAEVAHRDGWCRPEVDDGTVVDIEDGRHPVVERTAAAGRFVPNDVRLDCDGERLWLVTGPNMAGKSTLMRQVALAVILAQMGSFVPARRARIGVVDRVLSRVGASDNVSRGESTFMVEMRETAAILRGATRRSLVLLDEIGRGTSTYDGLAIAWAVAEHLHDAIGCRAMFATHYHELTEIATVAPGAANYSVTAREHGADVVFFHKIARGPASRSYGIAVARLAGLPEPVLARARAVLASLEAGGPLPSGAAASLRARGAGGKAQLDLFVPAAQAAAAAQSPAIEMLRAVDPDRLTPIEALAMVARLKKMTE